jgi:3-oxoacyl-[acyl-carrier-protein] synthase II
MPFPIRLVLVVTIPALFSQSIKMEAFIRSTGCISPQLTYDNSVFLNKIKPLEALFVRCEEPNYKEFIQPMQLRRMGRILKMGVTAAGICLKEAGVEVPDAIITGTGLGLVQDTEKFLTSILENDEKFLTPTSFIQSTHNTVGAHIAVMLNCNNYNFTYVHSNISFESALLDSLMQLEENPDKNILLGGLDEMTEMYYKVTQKAGMWRNYIHESESSGKTNPENVITGEGATYFLLTGKESPYNYSRFLDTTNFFKPLNTEAIESWIKQFIEKNHLTLKDIDLVLLGQQNHGGDFIFRNLRDGIFKEISQAWYKHLCGEYYTSSAFAAWMGANILKRQFIPPESLLNAKPAQDIKNILIYNHFRNIHHSMILLSAC